MPPPDRTLAAAALVLAYATLIGFTDNFVRVIADEAGMWQFHVIRSAMVFAILALVAVPLRLRLRPVSFRAVAARSALQGTAMLFYFGALAFLPVAQVAAGLFTAPVFVLIFGRLIWGHQLGPVRVAAVALGFAGVVMVLGPEAARGATLAATLPVLAGALYALANLATREWCAGESAEVLAAGFFAMMAILGVAGIAVLALWPLPVPEGTSGFVLRGWVTPGPAFWGWTAVQAAGSLVAVACVMRAYQLAEASRVAVFEYLTLPASAFWGWVIWSERLAPLAIVGMALIAAAGAMIALRARQAPAGSAA